ncbi:hypothetical protein H5410_037355 [Solanum commersonii]|uniref:Uncharacterized protein n=1 Tax=Solanum commersonii TaxID=4109 RepID=A0A9J5Y617_SOLCO|nr:hypothetical protein H5410_037355 [Solanum commersonii]
MHGIIRKNQVNKFKDKLNESFVFIIKNFKVQTQVEWKFCIYHQELQNLVYGRNDFMITVRLCRMCDAISPKKNDEMISMNMIFIDEKVKFDAWYNKKNQVNKFKDKFSEDFVFIIRTSKLLKANGMLLVPTKMAS